MTTYDPTSLLSNLKRAFSGFGAQVPGAAPSPFAIPKPAPFAMPAPVQEPTMGPTPIAPMQGPAPFIGPRPVAPVIAPPMAKATPVAPVVPRTSTGQTINTATGGIVAGNTATTPPVQPVPTYGASVTDSMGRTGEAKFDPNTGLPLTNPTPAVPIVPPSAEQSAVTAAETAYKTAGATTPEQDAAQAELDRLAESVRGGYEGAGQQAIPMEFITGQQKAIEQRGLRLAEPLTAKLARMEAKRTSSLATSKFALERADTALATTSAAKTAEATAKESARRFGIEQAGTAATRALAEKKFAQEYALKVREANANGTGGNTVGGTSTNAQNWMAQFNSGLMTIDDIYSKIGNAKESLPLRNEVARLVAEQKGKRVYGKDDASVQSINAQIKNIDDLLKPDWSGKAGVSSIVGKVQGGFGLPFTNGLNTGKQDVLAIATNLTANQTLTSLAEAKSKGITFGALSEGELGLVADAASRIAAKIQKNNKDNPNEVTGFSGSESQFIDDLNIIKEGLKNSVADKTQSNAESPTNQPQFEGYVLKADGKYYPK